MSVPLYIGMKVLILTAHLQIILIDIKNKKMKQKLKFRCLIYKRGGNKCELFFGTDSQ